MVSKRVRQRQYRSQNFSLRRYAVPARNLSKQFAGKDRATQLFVVLSVPATCFGLMVIEAVFRLQCHILRKIVCIMAKLIILISVLQFCQRAVIIKWPEALLKFQN